MIFGKSDNHVPPEGRDLIRKTLHEAGVDFSFYEVFGAQHAFIRDELSKGRYDPSYQQGLLRDVAGGVREEAED